MKDQHVQLFALALLTVNGFSARAAEAADEYVNIHTVGVISAIGDSINMAEVGSTVFGNAGYTVSTVDWHLDKAVAQQLTDAIKQRFTILPITADASSIEEKRDTEDMSALFALYRRRIMWMRTLSSTNFSVPSSAQELRSPCGA